MEREKKRPKQGSQRLFMKEIYFSLNVLLFTDHEDDDCRLAFSTPQHAC
jgi:hypothetical protein